MATDPTPTIIQDRLDSTTTIYVGFASFTVLIWDHLLTFGDEVQYIWKKKKKGPLIWLFFVNRYLTPLAFTVNLYAYLYNDWTPTRCEHFVRYEGSMTVIGINTSALMMMVRVYAMYRMHRGVVFMLAIVFAGELSTNAWLLSHGVAVQHIGGAHSEACSMIFDVNRAAATASAWLPLLYDTMVLVLTIRRTYSEVKHPTVGHTMRVLLKEGVWYYSVIFVITLALTIMLSTAPDGLKNMFAQTEYLMTVAMMSRITLHLKKDLESPRSLDPQNPHPTHDGWSFSSHGGNPTPITFSHPNHNFVGSGPGSPLAISVQEHSVTYDDHGWEVQRVQLPKTSHFAPHAKRASWAAHEEWIEFAPVSERARGRKDDSCKMV